MKIIMIITMTMMLSSCASMPELFKTVDDIATDGVLQVQIDKEAFEKNKNISVNILIQDPPK